MPVSLNTLIACGLQCFLRGKCFPVHCAMQLLDLDVPVESTLCVCAYPLCGWFTGDDTMTGDGGEYLRPEDLRELGDDSLPSSQFLDGMNYLRYSLEGGRSDRYLPRYVTFVMTILRLFCCKCVKSLCRVSLLGVHWSVFVYSVCQWGSLHFAGGGCGHLHLLLSGVRGWVDRALSIRWADFLEWFTGSRYQERSNGLGHSALDWQWIYCQQAHPLFLIARDWISRKENNCPSTDTTVIIIK